MSVGEGVRGVDQPVGGGSEGGRPLAIDGLLVDELVDLLGQLVRLVARCLQIVGFERPVELVEDVLEIPRLAPVQAVRPSGSGDGRSHLVAGSAGVGKLVRSRARRRARGG